MSYRPEWWPHDKDGKPYGVLALCEYVHGITTGQEYPYFPLMLKDAIMSLVWVRDNWKPPISMYDRAVLTLIVRTLNERKPEPKGPPDLICTRPNTANP